MKLCLFTDTLGDVNGVSRFIRNLADQALAIPRELLVITSTRFTCPRQANIVNVRPIYARPMPRYSNLEIVWPSRRELFRVAREFGPDVVHVSTPGPVGMAGRAFAKRHGVPLAGTYHTDFPAYVDHLFDDEALTWVTTWFMKWFYRPFDRIFSRSKDYAESLVQMGIPRHRLVRLLPGIDTRTFHVSHRDPGIWDRFPGVSREAVKILYVGRVSVEKNLPLLTQVWPRTVRLLNGAGSGKSGPRAQLIVIGDGPYKATMERDLAGSHAHFLGFRHGQELSSLYASCDAFVFPSTTDTLGQVVMEAQSAGLPVIVTDQGGPAEVVDAAGDARVASPSGYVLPATAADRWASTLAELVNDAELRARMGAAGHRKIQPMGFRGSFDHFWDVHGELVGEWGRGLAVASGR